jgi:acetoin utilization protein AcuC
MLTVIYSSEYLKYDFGRGHPFTPVRWEALADLLDASDLAVDWIKPDSASDSTVLEVHERLFVDTVKLASEGQSHHVWGRFGLGTTDVPVFPRMHDASCAVCGGSVAAAANVLDRVSGPVLQLGGGLHHAMPERAAGFCVYNDVAILIRKLRRDGLRVAYVDVDVHHGDGVQAIFYDDPEVLTVSLHESGRYLFPGTGWIDELGPETARGTSINVPLHPGTGDDSYLESFDAVVPNVVRGFSPDVLVVEVGADAHFADPLAHLSLTSHCFERIFGRLIDLADEVTGGRMAVTLGGGYAFESTIRVWSILAHCLARTAMPASLPSSWIDRWESRVEAPVPVRVHDPIPSPGPAGLESLAAEANRGTVEALMSKLGAAD